MKDIADYHRGLAEHYRRNFGSAGISLGVASQSQIAWKIEPQILRFLPTNKTFCWVHATSGMGVGTKGESIELFVMSRDCSDLISELLVVAAHYHQTGTMLKLGDTVNFGRPWLPGSRCSCGLISLPYTFGPSLENAQVDDRQIRVLWLVPITHEEIEYKKTHGLEALEQQFEKVGLNYLDANRASVCP